MNEKGPGLRFWIGESISSASAISEGIWVPLRRPRRTPPVPPKEPSPEAPSPEKPLPDDVKIEPVTRTAIQDFLWKWENKILKKSTQTKIYQCGKIPCRGS